jgi:methylthioribulose-1-phosphate dehydratase
MARPRLKLPSTAAVARSLAKIGRDFHARGWVLGTSGNFSVLMSRDPLRLAITASGLSKGEIHPGDVLFIGPDGEPDGQPVRGGAASARRRPSAETRLHLVVAMLRGAGAILHTHSVWSTMLSEIYAPQGGFAVRGFEMLKGLEGVTGHDHSEWIPIVENDQDMIRLARTVESALSEFPSAHAFLLRRHGLYTWGEDLAQAVRHVEILEFLFETIVRLQSVEGRPLWQS